MTLKHVALYHLHRKIHTVAFSTYFCFDNLILYTIVTVIFFVYYDSYFYSCVPLFLVVVLFVYYRAALCGAWIAKEEFHCRGKLANNCAHDNKSLFLGTPNEKLLKEVI